jgi:indolepyruvate ferredoxin oxidoreductase
MITVSPEGGGFTSNLIPYGKADLLIGVDVLEAARAIDPNNNQRVGSRSRTAVVVNTHKTPTILTLLGKDDFHVDRLEKSLREHTRQESYFSSNISALSEQFFGTQLYANIMMLGVAYQRGLLPMGFSALEWAIRTSLRSAADENIKAFNLGRLVAHDQRALERVLRLENAPQSAEEVLAEKSEQLAAAYRKLFALGTEQFSAGREAVSEFALRLYDLIQFENPGYAERYVNWVKQIHAIDRLEHGYAATKAVIWNLHKVMIIKDEVYVAHLLTSEEKHRRDRVRYNVDPARGDEIEYRHLNRPEFSILGRRVAWDMKTRDWMLNLMKHQRWLRRALPDWHKQEKDFREWYCGVLGRFSEVATNPKRYELFLQILKLPETVNGYREIRYPKMAAARSQAEQWFAALQDLHTEPAGCVAA